MTRIFRVVLVVSVLFVGFSGAQTRPDKGQPGQDKAGPKAIALKAGEPEEQAYDGGTARFLATSEETNGAWSLVELKEMPGYHTNLHRHVFTDEAFYVLEGVLTVRIDGKNTEYPAGSYVLIPHGTPHAQGNLGKVPVKLLLTMTPGGFERSLKTGSSFLRR